MDPPSLITGGSFQSTNNSSYNLAEIWAFPFNGGGGLGDSGGGLELRSVQFEQNLNQFAQSIAANRDVAVDDPMVLDQRGSNGGGGRKRREAGPDDDSPKLVSASSGNGMSDGEGKRKKTSGLRDDNCDPKANMETISAKTVDKNTQPSDTTKQDYIHVRARRGQATDSHSLAERARREKISERMKILQDLVPGCNKVIGKALVLDEIINYIQSLQRQVEFLSMKLEAVNSRANPRIEGFPLKDFAQQTFVTHGMGFASQATREYARGTPPEWLHMQVGSGFERTT